MPTWIIAALKEGNTECESLLDTVLTHIIGDGQSWPNPEIPLFGQFNFRTSFEWPKT